MTQCQHHFSVKLLGASLHALSGQKHTCSLSSITGVNKALQSGCLITISCKYYFNTDCKFVFYLDLQPYLTSEKRTYTLKGSCDAFNCFTFALVCNVQMSQCEIFYISKYKFPSCRRDAVCLDAKAKMLLLSGVNL